MVAVRCICCRVWSDADQAEDEYVRRGSLPIISTEAALEVKHPAEEQTAIQDQADDKEPSDTEGSVSVSEDKVEPSKETPVAESEAQSVKRVHALLTEEGLLLDEVLGKDKKKISRRLMLDAENGVLSWVVKNFFKDDVEKIQLSDARIMCTENLLKIGEGGKEEFTTFEAFDAEEAAVVCDYLVAHAKNKQEEEEQAREEAGAA